MISSNRKEQGLFWLFISLLVANNVLIMPLMLAPVWMGLAGAVLGISSLRKKLSPLLLCAGLGIIGGVAILMSFFILISHEGPEFATMILMGAFILWMLLLLTEKKEKARWWIFHFLGPVYTALQVLAMAALEPPAMMFVTLMVQTAVYMAISFKHTGNDTNENTQSPELSMRWVAMVMVGAMTLSLPIILGKDLINGENDLPSIGNLPGISTSNEMVMVAAFHEVSPIGQTYWETRDIYAIPSRYGQWESIARYDIPNRDKSQPHLLDDEITSTTRVGIGKLTYTHTVVGENLGFYMPGTIPNARGQSVFSWEKHSGETDVYNQSQTREAWVFYEDKTSGGFTKELDATYLSIPYGNFDPAKGVDLDGARIHMPRTWNMVQQWRAESRSDEEFIQRTLDYFRANLAYHFDHQSQIPEHNELDWFLFTDQKGVCRHFANAFGLIMRMGGIRSRIRGGLYAGETLVRDANIIKLRKRDAHAWNEVWIEGKGWVMIDPTSVVPVEKGIPENNTLLGGMMEKFANINFMEKFSTAGSAGLMGERNQVQKILDQARSALMGLTAESIKLIALIAMGLIGTTMALWWGVGAMRRWKSEDPCNRQWRMLGRQLERKGIAIGKNSGPRTIGKRVEALLESEEKQAWMKDVLDYERYRYGQESSPELEERLRNWRRKIKSKDLGLTPDKVHR